MKPGPIELTRTDSQQSPYRGGGNGRAGAQKDCGTTTYGAGGARGECSASPLPLHPERAICTVCGKRTCPGYGLASCREIVTSTSRFVPLQAAGSEGTVGSRDCREAKCALRNENRPRAAPVAVYWGDPTVARILHLQISLWGGWHTQGGWHSRGTGGRSRPGGQPACPPSADGLQYRTSVKSLPTNTSSHTDRARPSTKGSRWLETNHW